MSESAGEGAWERSATSDSSRVAYSVQETAAKLGVCEASIYRALARGQLQGVLLGGRRLIAARSIEDLLSAKGD